MYPLGGCGGRTAAVLPPILFFKGDDHVVHVTLLVGVSNLADLPPPGTALKVFWVGALRWWAQNERRRQPRLNPAATDGYHQRASSLAGIL